MTPKAAITYNNLLQFFWPLALQSIAQSFTYPLVAMVASRGDGGTLNMAGVAQASSLMFLFGTLGAGLSTTGMVFGNNRQGMRNYWHLNLIMGGLVASLQLIVCIPMFSHIIFGQIIGLPPGIERPAQIAFIASIPLQFLFFIRNPYQVCLIQNRATGLASAATLGRIGFTLALTALFSFIGFVGPAWALVCQTIPVGLEAFISWLLARPYMKQLPDSQERYQSVWEQFTFTLPLSLGGLFMSLSGMILGSVIAHGKSPELMLPAYYLANGLAAPMAFAATRIQSVVISFPATGERYQKIWRFAIISGVILGSIPLLFLLPGLKHFYYIVLQKCKPEMLGLVSTTACLLMMYPLTIAVRSFIEGRAALAKKSIPILTGQGAFLGFLTTISICCLALKVPGNLIPPISLILANLAAGGVTYFALISEKRGTDHIRKIHDGIEGYDYVPSTKAHS